MIERILAHRRERGGEEAMTVTRAAAGIAVVARPIVDAFELPEKRRCQAGLRREPRLLWQDRRYAPLPPAQKGGSKYLCATPRSITTCRDSHECGRTLVL